MNVYMPLGLYLKKQSSKEVPMTFAAMAKILGRALPQSAYRHRPWWANEAAGHSHAKAWLDAGFETAQVDMAKQKLVFRRAKPSASSPVISPQGLAEWGKEFRPATDVSALFGALKGTFTIEPQWDPAKSALEDEVFDIDKTADLIDSGLRGHL